jgi:hypothetical protein
MTDNQIIEYMKQNPDKAEQAWAEVLAEEVERGCINNCF